ncbi:hypothetical protein [[Phormidium ambiguum] IAM M-71]|nr:hypothetical protein [Phormidium ambiguum]
MGTRLEVIYQFTGEDPATAKAIKPFLIAQIMLKSLIFLGFIANPVN